MLSKEAFNALLKTLEEPPEHAYFCLATTEIHKIPETILSRCQVFLFGRFSLDQLVTRLEKIAKSENFKYEVSALNLIAQKAEGGLRDAISLLEQVAAESEENITEKTVQDSLGLSSSESLEKFYQALINKKTAEAFGVITTINQVGGDFRSFGHDFLNFCREKMFFSLEDDAQLPQIIKIIDEIEKALMRLKTTPIIELPLEIAIINIIKADLMVQNIANFSAQNMQDQKGVLQLKSMQINTENLKVSAKIVESKNIKSEVEIDSDEIVFTENKDIESLKKKNISNTEDVSNLPENIDFSGNVSQMDLEGKLKDIAEKAGIPSFARRSFLTTIPKISGNKIIFYTDSDFHREKLVTSAVLIPIKKAISEIFNGNFIVDIVLDENLKKKRAVASEPSSRVSMPMSTEGMASADDFLTF